MGATLLVEIDCGRAVRRPIRISVRCGEYPPRFRSTRCMMLARCSAKRAMHLSPRCRARTPCQSPAMTNGRCRMHGGTSPGAPKGNSHALRHGRYTAEAIAERREFAALLRDMKGLVRMVDGDEWAVNERHDSRVQLIAFLPSLIHCSAVPR
jgi:hypothetical protein